jgi:hypothetical protein
MGGEELLIVGVGGQAHRQNVQVGLPDPGHLPKKYLVTQKSPDFLFQDTYFNRNQDNGQKN